MIPKFEKSDISTQRRIVIGDVHGHYEGVVKLLEFITPAQDDQIYFLGDLIDRGPESSKVIDLIRNENYTTIIGNHEQMLIDAFCHEHLSVPELQAWLYSGGNATFANYENDLDKLLDVVLWFQTQPYHIDLGDIWLVHAGLNPKLDLEEQTIEDVCWIRSAFHSMSEPYFSDKVIITGHTITFTFPDVEPGQLVQGEGWIDIDTGAYHRKSGWLTAFDLDRWQVYQINVHTSEKREFCFEDAVKRIQPNQVSNKQFNPLVQIA